MTLPLIYSADIISTQEGIAVTELGKVALIEQFENLNVLVQIPKIPRHASLYCTFDEETRELGVQLENNFRAVLDDYNQFVESRRALLEGYLHDDSTGRTRRALWSTVGSFLYTTFVGGLSQIQILQLKNHLKSTQNEVDQLGQNVRNLKNELVLTQLHTVGLMKKFNYLLQRQIKSYNCISEMMAYILNTKLNILVWQKALDGLIWPAISGINSVPLSPSILDPEILTRIVQSHDTFKSLIFFDHPVYLYAISHITLVEIDRSLSLIKYVISFPRIKSENILPLVSISQVGLHLGGNLCKYFSLPSNAVSIRCELNDIELSDCTNHGSLYVCKSFSFPPSRSCIQESSFVCNYTVTECGEVYKLLQLKFGVLFRDNEEKHFCRDLTGRIILPPLTRSRVGLVTWNTSMELHDITVESPNIELVPFKMNNFSTITDFNISQSSYQSEIADLLHGYNNSIREEFQQSYGQHIARMESSTWIHVIIFIVSFVLVTVWLVTITVLLAIYRRCHGKIQEVVKYTLLHDPKKTDDPGEDKLDTRENVTI